MRHPPYHLRPNKAVDRLLLIEVIRKLERKHNLSEYTYYGLGGPYLEDFHLLYELCPDIKLVSIEEEVETFKRQHTHIPCCNIELNNINVKSFLTQYDPKDKKAIFWLDYTGLTYGNFEEFMALLGKVPQGSIVKVSVRAQPKDYFDQPKVQEGLGAERFRSSFGALLPDPTTEPPRTLPEYAYLIQQMFRIAAQKALPYAIKMSFQPIASFFYEDSVGMFTLTGVVCSTVDIKKYTDLYEGWKFTNIDWAKPKQIDVPILSTKERLCLQGHLPITDKPGKALHKALGYCIDTDRMSTECKLAHYADFHRYFPYYMKSVP